MLEFQAHVREGLNILGVRQAGLRRLASIEAATSRERRTRSGSARDYRWVRKHLSATDTEFTYAVARELFEMVGEAAAPILSDSAAPILLRFGTWVDKAQALEALDPDHALNEESLFPLIPTYQYEHFAREIVDALTGSRSKRDRIKVIVGLFHRECPRMAGRMAAAFPRRLEKRGIDVQHAHRMLQAVLAEVGYGFQLPKSSTVSKKGKSKL